MGVSDKTVLKNIGIVGFLPAMPFFFHQFTFINFRKESYNFQNKESEQIEKISFKYIIAASTNEDIR